MNRIEVRARRWWAVAWGAVVVAAATGAHAAGLLISDGGFGGVLEIKEHDVQVSINNGIAVTKVTQVFHNTEKRQVEALYTFPVPKGASVANFSMWINGKEMVGEVLEKKRAREIYNSYKQQRRDPGLLEQVDYKTFEMRVFPIGPDADQKVEVTYYQELDVDNDEVVYVYPLATVTRQDVDSRTTGKFGLNMEVKSPIPIATMESPSHGDAFVLARPSPHHHAITLETQGGSLARDVVLRYKLSRPRTGVDLITSRQGGDDGYFYLTITAGEDLAKQNQGMDYVFVVDVSGSMANDSKLILSKNSIHAFIRELAEEDRFEVLTFNSNLETLFRDLKPAAADAKAKADEFLSSQQARGGTILGPAIQTAYKYGVADRALNVVILSDGLTEQKEKASLLALIQSRPRNAHVFCVGVGNEVNRPLLEQLAQDSGGLAAFASQGDDLGLQARAFRRKLMRPAATDVRLDIQGVRVYDLEPAIIPNLYHGSPVRVYGRYSGPGQARIAIQANVQGVELKQAATVDMPGEDPANPEIERMWALKRVDSLQKKSDRAGDDRSAVIDEIVRLGEGYSIVTEYTSFLVLENDAEYQRWKIDRKNALRVSRDRKAQEAVKAEFEKMRQKALSDIGPAVDKAVQRTASPQAAPSVQVASAPSAVNLPPAPARSRQSFDFGTGGGSGPVGPLFVGFAAWLTWLQRRRAEAGRR